jgi:OmpA-OmpF porin, OOP family
LYFKRGGEIGTEKKEIEMRMKMLVSYLLIASALLLLSACGGKQLAVEPVSALGNPGEQVNQLDSEISAARQNQLNVLSPSFFAQAEKNLALAKQNLKKQGEISSILGKVAEARAQLKEAQKYAEISKSALPKAIKARDDARAAEATIFEEDYALAEVNFLELTKAVEVNNLGYAQKFQGRVEESFRVLELRAIKEKTLGDVQNTIEQAAKEGARRVAPELLDAANKELNSVDAFISANPYKKEEMLQKAGTALFNAQRLLEQTRLRNKLKEMSYPQISLWMEDILSQVTTQLAAPDMRNQSLETQVANINGTIGSLQSDRQFLGQQVKNLQGEMAECQQKIEERWASEQRLVSEKKAVEHEKQAAEQERLAAEQRLAAERRFHKMYTEVQNYFGKDEAEVYKQGYQLVIRLRRIQFPVGKAVIMPENYALLSKVQKAIRTFGDPVVVVEGHTDSTGSAATNELLSQKRAEAVKEYFLANQTLPVEKISAVGFGSSRPLASNENEAGRAVNRRIDLILTPTTVKP